MYYIYCHVRELCAALNQSVIIILSVVVGTHLYNVQHKHQQQHKRRRTTQQLTMHSAMPVASGGQGQGG